MAVTTRFGLTLLEQGQSASEVVIDTDLNLIDAGAAALGAANTFTQANVFSGSLRHTGSQAAFFGAALVSQQANTTDIVDVLTNLGFRATGGAPPLNLNGGNISAGTSNLSGGIRGNGGALSLGTTTVTYPSDADYTLLAAEMVTGHLIIAAGVITAPRNLIVPATTGGLYIVQNNNAQTVTVKTAAGTGVAIPSAGILIARTGANVVSVKPTV